MLRLLITWLGVFVFCQLNANAEQSRLCDQAPATDSPTNCNNTAGCYWNPTGTGNCNFCGKNHYCPKEDTDSKEPIACNTLGGGFNYTEDDGAGDETDCYKNIQCYIYDTDQDCIQYYNADGISCSGVFHPFEYNDDPKRGDVHLEKASSGSSQTACFTNVISCKKVKTNNCTQDNSKEAKYYYYGVNSEDQYWDISACRCTQNTFLGSDPAANCYAAITKRPKDPSTISYMETTVPIWEIQLYHCTSCKPGWMPVSGTPDSNVCRGQSNTGVITSICKCEKVPKGYYAENCSFEENSYYTLGTNNNCVTACPAGKTTNATGASDASACLYTDQTKFCDSKGCFSLSDIQNWTEVQ